MRMRDIQMYLSKFTNGNKGTAISDCEVFLEMEDGRLAQISNIELQESRMIGKINSSAAWSLYDNDRFSIWTNYSSSWQERFFINLTDMGEHLLVGHLIARCH